MSESSASRDSHGHSMGQENTKQVLRITPVLWPWCKNLTADSSICLQADRQQNRKVLSFANLQAPSHTQKHACLQAGYSHVWVCRPKADAAESWDLTLDSLSSTRTHKHVRLESNSIQDSRGHLRGLVRYMYIFNTHVHFEIYMCVCIHKCSYVHIAKQTELAGTPPGEGLSFKFYSLFWVVGFDVG